MAWKITKDFIDGEEEGVEGPRNCVWKNGPRYRFRMLDDDGELYYEGESDSRFNFAPLDDFGMPNAGCTEIRWLTDHGAWEVL